MDYLLKGVRAIDPAIGLDAKRDILIEDGVIARVEETIEPAEGVKVLERSGSLAFPGFVDVHVHLRDPGFEYKETIETAPLRQRMAASLISVRWRTRIPLPMKRRSSIM